MPLRCGIWGRTERDWEAGRAGHAGHLTGCEGQLWREHWLNGSDVGRLQGTGEVADTQTRGLVTQTTGRTPTSEVRLRSHCHTAALTLDFTDLILSCVCFSLKNKCMRALA